MQNPENQENQYWPLEGLTLGSFVQVISMDQQTCVLGLRNSNGKTGVLFFIEGTLYDAELGDLRGEQAALELVSWERVHFNVRKIENRSGIKRNIKKSLMSLLMDSTRERDELGEDDEFDKGDLAADYEGGPESATATADQADSGRETSPPVSEVAEGPAAAGSAEESDAAFREALEICIGKLDQEMAGSLIRSVIFDSSSGEVLAGQGIKLSVLEYYNELNSMISGVVKANQTDPGRYFLINIDETRMVVFLNFMRIRWAVDFDLRKMKLGVFLNAIVPKLIGLCGQAIDDPAQISCATAEKT